MLSEPISQWSCNFSKVLEIIGKSQELLPLLKTPWCGPYYLGYFAGLAFIPFFGTM